MTGWQAGASEVWAEADGPACEGLPYLCQHAGAVAESQGHGEGTWTHQPSTMLSKHSGREEPAGKASYEEKGKSLRVGLDMGSVCDHVEKLTLEMAFKDISFKVEMP